MKKTFGEPGFNDGATAVEITSDGGFIACGYSTHTVPRPTNDLDVWVAKFNADGELDWPERTFNHDGCNDAAYAVSEAPGGGYIVVASTNFLDETGGRCGAVLCAACKTAATVPGVKSAESNQSQRRLPTRAIARKAKSKTIIDRVKV